MNTICLNVSLLMRYQSIKYEAREVLSCDSDEVMAMMYKALWYFHQVLLCDDQFACKFWLQPGRMMLINNHRL